MLGIGADGGRAEVRAAGGHALVAASALAVAAPFAEQALDDLDDRVAQALAAVERAESGGR